MGGEQSWLWRSIDMASRQRHGCVDGIKEFQRWIGVSTLIRSGYG